MPVYGVGIRCVEVSNLMQNVHIIDSGKGYSYDVLRPLHSPSPQIPPCTQGLGFRGAARSSTWNLFPPTWFLIFGVRDDYGQDLEHDARTYEFRA